MRPEGSQGAQAVAAALALVAGWRPSPASRPPAIGYRPHWPGAVPPAWAADAIPPGGGRPRAATGTSTIAGAAQALRSGLVRSRDLVQDSLLAVEKHDAELVAMAHLMADAALAEADQLDAELARGGWRGPLHGIPVTVKDVIDVAGAPTRAGSAAYHDLPATDAVSVARLRAAGAVILGKVTTHEFALGVTCPQSLNPHDPGRIPGGSSGGSAVAVSTGMGLGSLGTDTRASIRVPAALSGVVGLKPTFGTIPTGGVVPLSWTMDHVAPMAATVEDAALMLDALVAAPAGAGVARWAGADPAGLRVGVPEAAFAGAEPGVQDAVRAALGLLAGLGCQVGGADRPTGADLDAANAAGLLVSRCEAATFHRHLDGDRALYWEEVADQLGAASAVGAMDYLDAQRLRADLVDGLSTAFDGRDVLAMPTVGVVAPRTRDFARHLLALSRNAIPWSLVGFPAVSVPCGWSEGLPVGLQLVAPPGQEHVLVAVGTALEAALG